MAETLLAEAEISTFGIVLKALRAATGPDALIMDEYHMNGQVATKEILRKAKMAFGRLTEQSSQPAE